ncbi:MAG: methyltransferase domain-containing protein [Acidobacteriota bacterium]
MFFLSTRNNEKELLDGELIEQETLAQNFRDLRRINHFFGGTTVVLQLLERVLRTTTHQYTSLRLLDVATGVADIPLAILHWAKHNHLSIEITAIDYSAEVLELAHAAVVDVPIQLVRTDARRLPFADNSFELVTCSLALHHFTDSEAVQVLRELARVARLAFIVNDLRRSLSGYLAAQAYATLLTRNRYTRNDAPLSVRRAFTTTELRGLAARANIGPVQIERQIGWRLSLLGGPAAIHRS